MCVCDREKVCVTERECVRACVRACVCVCVCVSAGGGEREIGMTEKKETPKLSTPFHHHHDNCRREACGRDGGSRGRGGGGGQGDMEGGGETET